MVESNKTRAVSGLVLKPATSGLINQAINFLDNKTVNKSGIFNTEISKVSLIPADKDGKVEPLSQQDIDSIRSETISGQFKGIIGDSKDFIRTMVDESYEADRYVKDIFSIDATSSITQVFSKTPLKVQAETRQVYIDGVIVNPTRITITGHISSSKLIELVALQGADQWFYILHSKDLGGTIRTVTDRGSISGSSVKLETSASLYYILGTSIDDSEFKNSVKVQIELEEVLMYEISSESGKYSYVQSNKSSGNEKVEKTETVEPDRAAAARYIDWLRNL